MGFLDRWLGQEPPNPNDLEVRDSQDRPDPQGKHNYLLVILDSCRFDTFLEAQPPTILKLGDLQKRWSYASWTAPSHYNLLMGLLPHSSPPQIFASEHYKSEYLKYNERLGAEGIDFKEMLPHLFLPTLLKRQLGYRTHAYVSMPVLNPHTILNTDFDTYRLMPYHNDMAAILDELWFDPERPSFHLLNIGETHYPYALPGEDPSSWPRISGVNGVLKRLDQEMEAETVEFFSEDRLRELRQRQVEAVKYLDEVFEELFDLVPPNTYITVTSDHGELFGEAGYFGHGPIQHEKVLEVPFLEGKIR
jgi:hypothetical protein